MVLASSVKDGFEEAVLSSCWGEHGGLGTAPNVVSTAHPGLYLRSDGIDQGFPLASLYGQTITVKVLSLPVWWNAGGDSAFVFLFWNCIIYAADGVTQIGYKYFVYYPIVDQMFAGDLGGGTTWPIGGPYPLYWRVTLIGDTKVRLYTSFDGVTWDLADDSLDLGVDAAGALLYSRIWASDVDAVIDYYNAKVNPGVCSDPVGGGMVFTYS